MVGLVGWLVGWLVWFKVLKMCSRSGLTEAKAKGTSVRRH
jgi:hypothetical protein